MKKEDFQTERTRIISNMLDNPDEYGIYPTTKCFNELDKLYDRLTSHNRTSTHRKLELTDGPSAEVKYDEMMEAFELLRYIGFRVEKFLEVDKYYLEKAKTITDKLLIKGNK